jgi:hypothetical protein
VKKFAENGDRFMGWLGGDRFASVVPGPGAAVHIRDAETGAEVLTMRNDGNAVFLGTAPPTAPAPYVGAAMHQGRSSVVLLRKDLARGRRVWEDAASGGQSIEMPRIDPFGEYVAWTSRAGPAPSIQMKHVNDRPDLPPTKIGGDLFRQAYFCDWTEEGMLLGNVSDDGRNWGLVIFDKKGQLVRRLDTDVKPVEGPVASWRKYEHQ